MAKNTKQSKQKKSVLNKLGGLSKRSKFIVVVLIFAVLGGGYLTYKSFAATAGPETVVNTAENLSFRSDLGCRSNLVNDPAKNNAKVMNVYCPANKFWEIGYRANGRSDPAVSWPAGYITICVLAKGVGEFRVSWGGYVDWLGSSTVTFNINDPNYKSYCTSPPHAIDAGRPSKLYTGNVGMFYSGRPGNKSIKYASTSATYLTIYQVSKTYSPPATPAAPAAPAPSGGK